MKTPILSEQDKTHLANVIAKWELKTSGEIRLMIVSRSAVTSHVPLLLWAMLLVTTFLFHEAFRATLAPYEHPWQWPIVLVVEFVLAIWVGRSESVQRRLTAQHDLTHQVWTRAEVEFHREGLTKTVDHTGVLLFLSLMERKAIVLADRGIASKVAPGTWDNVVATIVNGARTGQWVPNLEKALDQCGEYLAAHFPPKPGQKDELPNTVIVK